MSGVSAEVRMATDIARQFAHLPSAQAAEAVAGHIRRFWAPPMRTRLINCAAAQELPDSVRLAVMLLQSEHKPAAR